MTRRDRTGLTGSLLLATAFLLMIWAGLLDAEDERLHDAHYCRMVYQWQESEGEFGWPDYQNNATEICNDSVD